MASNPYSIQFGREPMENIVRASETYSVMRDFREESPRQQIYMITGVRGCGKTVFLTELTRRFQKEKDWIVIELSPEGDLLQKLASALASQNHLARIFQQASINLSFFGFGLEVAGSVPVSNIEVALSQMLASIKKHRQRVLVTIDEVTSSPSMRAFASAFQLFLRQDLPIYLLMTGLYENIEELQNEKNLTFLYRAPKIYLQSLNLGSIAENYEQTLSVTPSVSRMMAGLTMGYPLAFQCLGYCVWENNREFDRSIQTQVRQLLEESAYEIIWARLSPKDQQVAYGIARSETGTVQEIRAFLGMETNQFNPYRRRLIRKGLIQGDEWGKVRFALPFFDAFVLDMMEE